MKNHSEPSQEKAILDYMLAGNSITPLIALQKFGSLRLGARIFQIRKKHNIKMIRITVGRKKKSVASYSITK